MENHRYRIALQLGWLLASLCGQLTQPNLRWRDLYTRTSAEPVGRLFLSTREPRPGESVWSYCISVGYLLNQLYLNSKSHDEATRKQLFELSSPPPSVVHFISEMDKALQDEAKLDLNKPQFDTLLSDINYWSRKIWSTLNSEDHALSDFASLGAGLSDTYWQWRLQKRQPKSQQTIMRLLRTHRSSMMLKRIQQLQGYMPDIFAPSFSHSFRQWSDYVNRTDIEIDKDEIKRYYAMREELKVLKKEEGEALAAVQGRISGYKAQMAKTEAKFKTEEDLKKTFRIQTKIWEDLIFSRPVEYRLKPLDLRFIQSCTVVVYLLATILVTVLLAVSLYGLLLLINYFLARYMNFGLDSLKSISDVEDQLKLIAAIATLVSFLAPQFGRFSKFVKNLYPVIYRWFYLSKIIQRTYHAPTRRTMHIVKVWMNMVFRDVLEGLKERKKQQADQEQR